MKLALVARHLHDDQEHILVVKLRHRVGDLVDRMEQEIAEDTTKDWTYAIRPATPEEAA